MPTYFGPIAPYCPISRDSPLGPETWAPSIRTVIPRAYDLASALLAVNIARSIVTQLVIDKVINNVHTPPPPKTVKKTRTSRWKQGTPVKRKYKYYLKDENGEKDKDSWVMTERIENLTWTDRAWQTSLNFTYGDKGDEGEPVGGGGAATGGADFDTGDFNTGDFSQ
jgi:hypothetical protein